MVKGKTMQRGVIERPSVNYRELDSLNQSMLRTFDENPVQFFKEFKMGEPRFVKDTTATITGDLVDYYLLECHANDDEFTNSFDDKFVLNDGSLASGQVADLTNNLFSVTMRDTVDNSITTSFSKRFDEAAAITQAAGKYKNKPIEKILEDFDKNGKQYFEFLLSSVGKKVVTPSLIEKSKLIGNNMKSDPFTNHIFRDNMSEFLPHFPIEWEYKLDDDKFISCKSEIDLLKVDDKNKIIYIYDLKTSYDNESFQYSYIKNYYYLQAAFYVLAVSSWKNEVGMSDYVLRYMEFVVGDTSGNNRRPLVYQTTSDDFYAGLNGFELRGTKYRGVHELIADIAWAESTGNWNVSKEAVDNNGILELNINYDKVNKFLTRGDN